MAQMRESSPPLSAIGARVSPVLVCTARDAVSWSSLHSTILCSQADSLCSCHMWFWMSGCSFLSHFLNIHRSSVPTVLFGCYMASVTRNCWYFGAYPVYTIHPCTSLQHHFMQSHIHRVRICLAVTSHLHFWQTDWDLLHATAVTQEWNGCQNKSQHRKVTLEKKILLLLLQGLKSMTIHSQVQHSTSELSQPPKI